MGRFLKEAALFNFEAETRQVAVRHKKEGRKTCIISGAWRPWTGKSF
jgi:phosphoserine phosphatase